MSTGTASPKLSMEAERALGRSYLYKYLSLGFMQPEEEFWGILRSGIWVTGLEKESALLGVQDLVSKSVARLKREAERVTRRSDLEELRIEYTRIFSLPQSPVSLPYETEYTSPHPFMKSRELSDILGFYQAFGLRISEFLQDRADFLATELEFMHFLCLKEADACMKSEKEHKELVGDAERKFLQDHLGRWLEPFRRGVGKNAKLSFYPALADLTAPFVRFECSFFGARPDLAAESMAPPEQNDACDLKCPLAPQEESEPP